MGREPARRLAVGLRPGERHRSLDDKRTTLAEHLAVLPTLAWTAADGELVSGAPAARRRFLDRGLVHLRPALLGDLGRYERALAEKRALLARGGRGELAPWNALLARHGASLAAGRSALVEALARELAGATDETGLALPPLSLAYRPSPAAAVDGETALVEALARAEKEERRRGRPTLGPHRDELEISWAGSPAREVASGGERKALGLLLQVSLARLLLAAGREPLVLVDDADAELDRARLAGLLPLFEGFEQVFLTSNRPEIWPPSAALARLVVTPSGPAPEGES